MALGSSFAYYKIEREWVSEVLTYGLYRAIDATSSSFDSWLESEGYFWANTVTTRNDFKSECVSMSDAGYTNFAFILEGGTGNDTIRIFLRK